MVRLFINSKIPGFYEVVTPFTTKTFDNFEALVHFICDECEQDYPMMMDDPHGGIQEKVDQLGEAMDKVNGAIHAT